MDAAHYGLIEMALVFGFVLALAIYELMSVRRQLGDDAAKRSNDSDPASGSDADRTSPADKSDMR